MTRTLGRGLVPALPAALLTAAAATLAVLAVLAGGAPAQARGLDEPVDDYATYQPQTRCRHVVRPGTTVLAQWINRRFEGGTASAALRSCGTSGTSEHKDGRAIDWTMDAASAADRAEVDRFLERVLRTDAHGNRHALARRMGIMYLIWDDHMYASYDRFRVKGYQSSSCPRLRGCSPTLRHRDHVHISLSRAGGRGDTSWYAPRL